MKGVGMPHPLFIDRGQVAHIWDADGNEYIDFVSSWGPMILGRGHPEVRRALHEAIDKGTSFGAPTEVEVRLAELLCHALPSLDMVRFTSSSTEATMSAVRVARGATGRDKVVKFAGGYHGHSDAFLVQAGSVYQAGTLSGNPVAMAAGLETLQALSAPGTYNRLEDLGARVEQGLIAAP